MENEFSVPEQFHALIDSGVDETAANAQIEKWGHRPYNYTPEEMYIHYSYRLYLFVDYFTSERYLINVHCISQIKKDIDELQHLHTKSEYYRVKSGL